MSSSQPVCLQPRRVLQQFHLGAGLRQATVHGWQQQRRCNSTRHTNVGISYRNSQSSGSIGAVKTTDCEWMGQSNLQGACENSSHSSSSSSLLTGNCRSSRNNAASPLQGSSRSGQQGMPAPPSSNSNTQHSKQGRRVLVLHSTLMPTLLLLGSDDATTIVNSILSGYGLPTLKPSQGFKPYDEFDDDYVFEYPRSWVARRNSLRQGVYIADFQTADKVAVEVLDPPADDNLQAAAVAAAVIPPGGQEDATLNLPAQRLIKSAAAKVDGQDYLYLEFPSETTTRSGYNIKRKNFVVAGIKRDKLFVLSASARSDQYNDDKKEMLQHIVQSFRLR